MRVKAKRGNGCRSVNPLPFIGDKRIRLNAIGSMSMRRRAGLVIGVRLEKIMVMVVDRHLMAASNMHVGFYRGLQAYPYKADHVDTNEKAAHDAHKGLHNESIK
jgi:hypothetical protein